MSVRAVPPPNYSLLTTGSHKVIIDATGLRDNITNVYGTVGSNIITSVSSILPGQSFTFTDNGSTGASIRRSMCNGLPVIDMQGTRWLRSTAAVSSWDFLSHHASGVSGLRWSITMLMRSGYGSAPGNFQGIMGTNGATGGNKGFMIASEDRDAVQSNSISHQISRGAAGFVSSSGDADQMTPNEWAIWRFTFDGSLATASRFKAYKNGVALSTNSTSSTSTTQATPTNTLEIGNVGGGANFAGFMGQISHVIIQTVVESTVTADAFEDTLEPFRDALNNTDNTYTHPYNFISGDGTRYFIGIVQGVHPSTPGKLMRIYRDGNGHIGETTSKAMWQLSTDYGLTWTTGVEIIHPTSPVIVGATSGGYSSTGRFWILCEYRTIGGASELPFEMHALYTDNDGASWTDIDLTSQVPADGLDRYIFYGAIVETSTGRLGFPFYKLNATATSSANYFAVTDNAGSTWSFKTVRSPAVTYINEMATVQAGNRTIVYARNESTKEWTYFSSTDNLETWTDHGDITLGETLTVPSPLTFSKFNLYGVNITACWMPIREADPMMKVVFAKTSSLEADGTAFDLDTKVNLRARQLQYGMMVHPYGDLYSLGAFGEEPIPITLTENRLISLFGGVFMKQTLLTEFGITPV